MSLLKQLIENNHLNKETADYNVGVTIRDVGMRGHSTADQLQVYQNEKIIELLEAQNFILEQMLFEMRSQKPTSGVKINDPKATKGN